MELRHPTHPQDFKTYTTQRIRDEFLVTDLFRPDAVSMTYSFNDRMIIGGACPQKPLALEGGHELGTDFFLQRRELGIVNVGPAGTVTVQGTAYDLEKEDALYVGLGNEEIVFSSRNPEEPARFYFLSGPAHKEYPTTRMAKAEVEANRLGVEEHCNMRVLRKYIHPAGVQSANLVLGITAIEPGSVWNSLPPCHTHARRMEVYLYYDLAPDAVVFHLMGEPDETRHLVVHNEEAVISPSWSLHAGAGTSHYTFIWGMVGDNQAFTDMDVIGVDRLR